MLCRKGKIIDMRVEGVPIGLLEAQEYEEVTITAEPNDLLLLYSDGVEDQLGPEAASLDEATAISQDLETYGHERLENLVRANCRTHFHVQPQRLTEKIFEDIDQFRGSTALTDDQTVVALRVL
jgi:sigma-B regulation protein RsbU (phosphoserine phosphatase)